MTATNPTTSSTLPMLGADVFLSDGGLETTLIFEDGFELPDFAAFTLLGDPVGRSAVERYYDGYAAIAVAHRVGTVLDSPTWRASSDWGARLGLDADAIAAVNRDAVGLLEDIPLAARAPPRPWSSAAPSARGATATWWGSR